jgi:hypothetical protein
MAFEPTIAIFDACVLYPFHLRNILVQAAVDRIVDARWTDEIHDEWIRNLASGSTPIPIDRLQRTRQLMDKVLPQALVREYESHIPLIKLPDPDDRHVVAAGITAGASIILTWNLRDFPPPELRKHKLRRTTPDRFLTGIYNKLPDLMVASLANARRNLTKSATSALEFVEIMREQRLTQLTKRVAKHLTDL